MCAYVILHFEGKMAGIVNFMKKFKKKIKDGIGIKNRSI